MSWYCWKCLWRCFYFRDKQLLTMRFAAPPAIQEEMLQNMQLMPMFGYYGGASLAESHSVRFSFLFSAPTCLLKLTANNIEDPG